MNLEQVWSLLSGKFDSAIAALRGDIGGVVAAVTSLTSKVDELARGHSAIEERQASQRDLLKDTREDLGMLRDAVAQIEQRVRAVEQETVTLKVKVALLVAAGSTVGGGAAALISQAFGG